MVQPSDGWPLQDPSPEHPDEWLQTTQVVEQLRSANEELRIQAEELEAQTEEITAQNEALRAAGQALEDERRRYQELFDLAPGGYLVTDQNGNIREANHAAAGMLGVRAERLAGKPLVVFVVKEERPTFYAQLASLQAGRAAHQWEMRLRPRTGELLSVLVDVAAMRDAPGLRWLLRDITERKRMEKELEQLNWDLVQLYQMSQTLTATLDLQQVMDRLMQGITEIVNAQATSLWLWDKPRADELVCRAAFYPGAERPPVGLRLRPGQCFIGWVAQNSQSVFVAHASDDPRFDPAIDRHTGLPTTSLLAAPLLVRDAVIGVLQVVNKLDGEFDARDLTLIETLSSPAAIAIDNAQLVEAQRRFALMLQARNEELDAYGHTVAHDLKNPAALIISYAQVLDSDGATLSEAERGQCVQAIVQGGFKMIAIIDDLLLLASVRQKSVPASRLDMRPIVSEAAERLAPLVKEHRAELVLPPWGAWPTANGYAPWVEEVWVNYISNALKYGGTPSTPPRVELGGEALPNGMARFWVRDNGPGLTPEEQARLFTPFTRVGQAHASGHGLGLSIVRRIVERLGGQAHVQSAPGQGSVFSFTLPGAGE